MITFSWADPICEYNENGDVHLVHWRRTGTDGTFTADSYGAQLLPEPDLENYIPFDDLTKETILLWLYDVLDMEAIENNIENQIELLQNPINFVKTFSDELPS